MKKRWKRFWIVCGITAGVGLVCCVLSLAMGVTAQMIESRFPYGIGYLLTGKGPVAANVDQSYDGIRSIDMDIGVGDVEIIPTREDQVRVETEGLRERIGFQCGRDGDTLELTTKHHWLRFLPLGEGKIRLYLPENLVLEEASLNIGAGRLIAQTVSADSISLSVGAGEADVDWLEAREIDLDCGAGEITAAGNAVREVDIDCGVGDVEFAAAGSEQSYNYKIRCGVGNVDCGEGKYSGIGVEQDIQNGADRTMDIDCGVGNVTVDFENGF